MNVEIFLDILDFFNIFHYISNILDTIYGQYFLVGLDIFDSLDISNGLDIIDGYGTNDVAGGGSSSHR